MKNALNVQVGGGEGNFAENWQFNEKFPHVFLRWFWFRSRGILVALTNLAKKTLISGGTWGKIPTHSSVGGIFRLGSRPAFQSDKRTNSRKKVNFVNMVAIAKRKKLKFDEKFNAVFTLRTRVKN